MSWERAYTRGQQDAQEGKEPLFRQTRQGIVPKAGQEQEAKEWSQDDRFHYLQGYEA